MDKSVILFSHSECSDADGLDIGARLIQHVQREAVHLETHTLAQNLLYTHTTSKFDELFCYFLL